MTASFLNRGEDLEFSLGLHSARWPGLSLSRAQPAVASLAVARLSTHLASAEPLAPAPVALQATLALALLRQR